MEWAWENLVSLLGILLILGLAFFLSTDRRSIQWKIIIWGLGLQIGFAFLILDTGPGRWFFSQVNDLVLNLLSYERAGAEFVFGVLAIPPPDEGSVGFIFAVQVLPTIIFLASLMAVLYHLRIVQTVVGLLSRFMRQLMGTSGAETVGITANVVLGYIESPLLIRPYLRKLTRSELVAVMTAGMATVAGGVMVAFVGMLRPYFPDIAGHLLAASVMAVPAATAIAKMMVPETEQPQTVGSVHLEDESDYLNIIDAAASGAVGAVKLVVNIAATLIAFMALLSLLNGIVGWSFGTFGFEGVSIQSLLGYLFAPFAFLLGVPWVDCLIAGQLFAEKIFLNEFVAFLNLKDYLEEGLSPRATIIITYALTGFANFLSLGAMIGGMSALVPERKYDIARDGFRAMTGGAMASFLNAAVAGLILT